MTQVFELDAGIIRRVVLEMRGYGDEFIPYVRQLAADLGLPVEHVRMTLRHLGEQGLATYGPLFNHNDCRPAGSSWFLTEKGLRLQQSLEAEQRV